MAKNDDWFHLMKAEDGNFMGLRDMILKIAGEYAEARQQKDLKHPVCDYIRNQAPQEVQQALSNSGFNGSLACSGGHGFGNIAYCPWVSILHPKAIDPKTNEKRYSVVYLFSYDLLDVHLCLLLWENGNPFDLKGQQKREHLDKLRLNAQNIPKFMQIPQTLSPKTISLGAPNPGSFVDFYEAGYVIGKSYRTPAQSLPPERSLVTDLIDLTTLYVDMAERYGTTILL